MTLDEVLTDCLTLLAAGPDERNSPYRLPTLATLGRDGMPEARTVVVRGFDAAGPGLLIHTDADSAKVAEIRAHPLVGLHVWDTARRQQIRLRGYAHTRRDADATAWAALPELGRSPYSDASALLLIEVAVHSLEWLRLTGQGGQMRARFDWRDGVAAGTWLTP